MSSFLNLCSCEFTKIRKKKSTKIMMIILVLSVFVAVLLSILTKEIYNVSETYYSNADYKTMEKTEMEALKAELENYESSLDVSSKNTIKAKIDTYQMAIDYDINIYNNYWKNNVLMNDILISKVQYYDYKSIEDEELANIEDQNINKKLELIKNDDFDGYMNTQKDILKANYEANLMSKEEYDIATNILDIRTKYKIGKEYNPEDSWKETIIEEIEVLSNNIRYGVDTVTQKALSEKDVEKAKDSIKMNEYRLEHNMPPYATATTIGNTRKIFDYVVGGTTLLALSVMIIIIAGSSISSEISKGTIKFWSFTPNKRWKVLLSKLVVTVIILILASVVMSIISTIVGNVFFGSENAQGYIYVKNGAVHEINYLAYIIIYNLLSSIEVFMFLLFAMMLSTVTRNTAISVGVSIATYLGGSTIMSIVNSLVNSEWVKFIPSNNLSIAERVFSNDITYSASTVLEPLANNSSVSFSLILLGVCALIMIVTMFDSYRKRDII